jgi:hypothetical protein
MIYAIYERSMVKQNDHFARSLDLRMFLSRLGIDYRPFHRFGGWRLFGRLPNGIAQVK